MPQHVDRQAPLVLLNCAWSLNYACPRILSGGSRWAFAPHPLGFGLPSLGDAENSIYSISIKILHVNNL